LKNSLRLFEIFDLLSTITQRISRVFFLQGKSDTGLQISPEVPISQFRTYVPVSPGSDVSQAALETEEENLNGMAGAEEAVKVS
jgi:hypothetical protein